MATIAPPVFPFARRSAGAAPLRRPRSVRRTTSIDSSWPDGPSAAWNMVGRARDLLTGEHGETTVLAVGGFDLWCSPTRTIEAITVEPPHPRADTLVGLRAGGASRSALATRLGDLVGSPLFQLLDDFAGASLVARWIWSQWTDDGMPAASPSDASSRPPMIDICTGFAEGASSLLPDGRPDHAGQSNTDVGPLLNAADPVGWHEMPELSGVTMRRARRVDVWRDGDMIQVDAGFQDSGSNPRGGRTAVHEYAARATIDVAGILVALEVTPLILPYRECPGAAMKAQAMVGHMVSSFRDDVLATLRGAAGCTHLNDVLRALADVPSLAKHLPASA